MKEGWIDQSVILKQPEPEPAQPAGPVEVVLFEAPKPKPRQLIKDNALRHFDNLNRLHGAYYKGTYYHHGVGQPNKSGGKR